MQEPLHLGATAPSTSHATPASNELLRRKYQTTTSRRRRSTPEPADLKVSAQHAQVSSRQNRPEPSLQRRIDDRHAAAAAAFASSKFVVEHLRRNSVAEVRTRYLLQALYRGESTAAPCVQHRSQRQSHHHSAKQATHSSTLEALGFIDPPSARFVLPPSAPLR